MVETTLLKIYFMAPLAFILERFSRHL